MKNLMMIFEAGVICLRLEKYQEAVLCFKEYITRDPDHFNSYVNLSYAFEHLRKYPEALEAIDLALSIRPENPGAHTNRACILRAMGHYEMAIEIFRKQKRATPFSRLGLAETLTSLLRIPEAIEIYENLIREFPHFLEARYALGKTELLLGELPKGFKTCESRIHLPFMYRPPTIKPWWRGEPIEGKRLFVCCEQGLGDTIQFMRYIPRLFPYKCEIIVGMQPGISSLFAHLPIKIIDLTREEVPEHDRQVYLMSLPHLFNTNLSSILRPISIAGVNPRPILHRIGFVWRGSSRHTKDFERSIPLELFEPLFHIPRIEAVCLQEELSEEEARFLDAHGVRHPLLNTWQDTLRELEQCEKIICVDTAIAHLAASIGIPTWILIHYSPDWRWLLDRTDSPWYPSATLFRQTTPLHWEDPIKTILTQRLLKKERPNFL